MKLHQGSLENLKGVTEWTTVQQLSKRRNVTEGTVSISLKRLFNSELVERRRVSNPNGIGTMVLAYKRTRMGDKAMLDPLNCPTDSFVCPCCNEKKNARSFGVTGQGHRRQKCYTCSNAARAMNRKVDEAPREVSYWPWKYNTLHEQRRAHM